MTTEDWRIQVSWKTQMGAMINCRANSAEELDAEINAVNARIAQILATEQQLFGGGTVAAALPLAPVQPQSPPPPPAAAPSPWGAQAPAPGFPAPSPAPVPMPQAAPAQAPAASPGAGPLCQHNLPAKWVEGGISKKTGKPYNGFWACPLDREHQCQIPR